MALGRLAGSTARSRRGSQRRRRGPGDTSIQYQQALEHQNDPDTFVPGDAVTIPYQPRAGDTTEVDGGLPVALPAGTASGRSMAASPQGSVWAVNDVATPTPASF